MAGVTKITFGPWLKDSIDLLLNISNQIPECQKKKKKELSTECDQP